MSEQPDRSGTTLGPYELKRLIGRGGMGEVYEAIDTRLGRPIALKVLRPEVVEDAERRARFEREAKALAALSHPGIVTIHAFETIDDVTFFTMELVSGRTLTEVIGAEDHMPVQRVLELGIPIADAVATAHRQGIAHRDLKPDNILVGPRGEITVLDFGLAKLASPVLETDAGESATASIQATVEGRIFGTVNYMSPEQAQGGETNPTTDVFSLGVILYEMATGATPFTGETTLSMLSSILKDDPTGMQRYTDDVPEELERIIRRCLEKDPDRRWQTAIDVRNELEILRTELSQPNSGPASHTMKPAGANSEPETSAPSRRGLPMTVVAALMVVTAGAAMWIGDLVSKDAILPETVDTEPSGINHVSIAAPEGFDIVEAQLSPNGRLVAMRTREQASDADDGGEQSPLDRICLFVRSLDAFDLERVPGSERAIFHRFSPDGQSLLFIIHNDDPNLPLQLMRFDLGSNIPPTQVTSLPRGLVNYMMEGFDARGFCWLDENTVVFLTDKPYEIVRINAVTGEEIGRMPITFANEAQPNKLVDGIGNDRVLVCVDYYNDRGYNQDLVWANPLTGETDLAAANAPHAMPCNANTLAIARGSTLHLAPFDPATAKTTGTATPQLAGLRTRNTWGGAMFDVSGNGTIAYLPGGLQGGQRTIWLHEPDGEIRQLSNQERALEEKISVSDDGSIFLTVNTNSANNNWDMLIGNTSQGRMRTFAAYPDRDVFSPAVSPDGSIAAVKLHTTVPSKMTELHVYSIKTGKPLHTLLGTDSDDLIPLDISPDNSELVYSATDRKNQTGHLKVIPIGSDDAVATPSQLVDSKAVFPVACWSPDGTMLAYISTESGQPEAFVAPYADRSIGEPVSVSNGLAKGLAWVRINDQLELRYVADRVEYACTAEATPSGIDLGPPTPTGRVFSDDAINYATDLSGRMFVIRKGRNERPANRVQIITNRFNATTAASNP